LSLLRAAPAWRFYIGDAHGHAAGRAMGTFRYQDIHRPESE